jgi:hypothetical protein
MLFSGLERKISVRTTKEELIQRGILVPGVDQGPAPPPHQNNNKGRTRAHEVVYPTRVFDDL